jgi:hypothetical protein
LLLLEKNYFKLACMYAQHTVTNKSYLEDNTPSALIMIQYKQKIKREGNEEREQC